MRITLGDILSGRVRIVVRRRRPRRKLKETPEVAELRKQAKAYLPGRLAELAAEYGFSYNQVRIKHNVSNWGSCSVKGNINLNLNLMRLPQDLQDYVMLHELCHLKHMNHGPKFHALLESVCPDHLALRRRLKGYKLI
ncbi:MAG: M48 family metallopeptidase [Bacteroidales bacterium]|nr:M48 family metallopeptidase [Bacteroidales bacterium]